MLKTKLITDSRRKLEEDIQRLEQAVSVISKSKVKGFRVQATAEYFVREKAETETARKTALFKSVEVTETGHIGELMQAELELMIAEDQQKSRRKAKNHFYLEAKREIDNEAADFD